MALMGQKDTPRKPHKLGEQSTDEDGRLVKQQPAAPDGGRGVSGGPLREPRGPPPPAGPRGRPRPAALRRRPAVLRAGRPPVEAEGPAVLQDRQAELLHRRPGGPALRDGPRGGEGRAGPAAGGRGPAGRHRRADRGRRVQARRRRLPVRRQPAPARRRDQPEPHAALHRRPAGEGRRRLARRGGPREELLDLRQEDGLQPGQVPPPEADEAPRPVPRRAGHAVEPLRGDAPARLAADLQPPGGHAGPAPERRERPRRAEGAGRGHRRAGHRDGERGQEDGRVRQRVLAVRRTAAGLHRRGQPDELYGGREAVAQVDRDGGGLRRPGGQGPADGAAGAGRRRHGTGQGRRGGGQGEARLAVRAAGPHAGPPQGQRRERQGSRRVPRQAVGEVREEAHEAHRAGAEGDDRRLPRRGRGLRLDAGRVHDLEDCEKRQEEAAAAAG
ncbi:hypothetical protein THAOC_15391 [Thalassiosira oceanica]|uniref:Uncharacterized protein n=1 Tax=Thalassiosira oceanica TaxID=159749 RepID=K0SCQ7_THAOC|nr:hypothetical protein THAOC_15391 [Thalassiosira oceanica]|eukprot:EJK63923.1 hypothetical protein THAOC_15391 [Thalassiosira oceanica]